MNPNNIYPPQKKNYLRLYGKKLIVYTDHRALQWLFNCQNPSSKLVRWRLRLSEYQYEIKYKPGRMNSNADGLSRLFPQGNLVNLSMKKPLTYQDFIEFHYKNQDVIIYKKENTPISKIKDIVILLWSQDLSEENSFYNYIRSTFDLNNVEPPLNHFKKLEKKSTKTLPLIPNQHAF